MKYGQAKLHASLKPTCFSLDQIKIYDSPPRSLFKCIVIVIIIFILCHKIYSYRIVCTVRYKRGKRVISISDDAAKVLHDHMKAQSKTFSCIRIHLESRCCRGPMLVMTWDDPDESDAVFKEKGLTVLVNANLLERTGRIIIHYNQHDPSRSFEVQSEIPIQGIGGSINSCCHSELSLTESGED
jgi:Fe-S cluster assembly iron-binding protein IscA